MAPGVGWGEDHKDRIQSLGQENTYNRSLPAPPLHRELWSQSSKFVLKAVLAMVEGTFSILESCFLCKHLWNTSPEHRQLLPPLVGCCTEVPGELSVTVFISVNTVHTGNSFHWYRKYRWRIVENGDPCVSFSAGCQRCVVTNTVGSKGKKFVFLAYFFASLYQHGCIYL